MNAVLEPSVTEDRVVYTEEELAEKAERYRGELTSLAQNHVGDYGLAQDAVQEAIIYLCRQAGKFDSRKATLRTVLGRLVCYYAAHIADAEAVRHPPAELPGFDDGEPEFVLNHDGVLDYPRRAQRRRGVDEEDTESSYDPAYADRVAVQQALARLPAPLRRVAVAVYMNGETQEEYANRIGISQQHASRLLARAKARLVSDLS